MGHREDAIGPVSRIGAAQCLQAPQDKDCIDQQHQGECDLDHHEGVPNGGPILSVARSLASIAECIIEVDSR